jgi:putative hemolysin
VNVPRSEIVALRRDSLRADLVAALQRTPHARYPVIDDTLDSAVGYIAVRDVAALLADPAADLVAAMKPAWFIPESRPALAVLEEMQRNGTPLALIVDVLGSVCGLVTIGDLLEELVGEIRDATRRESPLIERECDDAIVVSGRMPVHDLNRTADLSLPEGPGFSTLSGLVIARLGRIPRPGTVIVVDGTKLEVLEATPRRVVKVRVTAPR